MPRTPPSPPPSRKKIKNIRDVDQAYDDLWQWNKDRNCHKMSQIVVWRLSQIVVTFFFVPIPFPPSPFGFSPIESWHLLLTNSGMWCHRCSIDNKTLQNHKSANQMWLSARHWFAQAWVVFIPLALNMKRAPPFFLPIFQFRFGKVLF